MRRPIPCPQNSRTTESLTALLIGLNIRYKTHAGIRITDIQDGSSNTIAFGETVGGQIFPDGSTDFKTAWGDGGQNQYPQDGKVELEKNRPLEPLSRKLWVLPPLKLVVMYPVALLALSTPAPPST